VVTSQTIVAALETRARQQSWVQAGTAPDHVRERAVRADERVTRSDRDPVFSGFWRISVAAILAGANHRHLSRDRFKSHHCSTPLVVTAPAWLGHDYGRTTSILRLLADASNTAAASISTAARLNAGAARLWQHRRKIPGLRARRNRS
jgi:hypothetical protein